MTEMDNLKAGLPYRYDDPELVKMKDTASLRCARLSVGPRVSGSTHTAQVKA